MRHRLTSQRRCVEFFASAANSSTHRPAGQPNRPVTTVEPGPPAATKQLTLPKKIDALLAPSVTRRLLDRFADALPGPDAPAPADLGERPSTSSRSAPRRARALNAEIAERLFLTEATVKTHVSSILRKLGLRDRVQAVVLAYDVGLARPRSA